eukprot:TRINITY_DN4073_c0_g1_i4.p2 TRINITY_DN4073_c0_g1~~TRINITY_DN4073_c0_g1_i4.p2  ORF type:complete len:106 (+),score=28.17 TRINITY_DN4073_c0_g1_i4:73-390(+)
MCIRDRYQRRVHGSARREIPLPTSKGVSPGLIADSPFNPRMDGNAEREPSYLKEMELSPPRHWTEVGDGGNKLREGCGKGARDKELGVNLLDKKVIETPHNRDLE